MRVKSLASRKDSGGRRADLKAARGQVESQVDEIAGLVVAKIIGRGV